jgi:hypothetical protein
LHCLGLVFLKICNAFLAVRQAFQAICQKF